VINSGGKLVQLLTNSAVAQYATQVDGQDVVGWSDHLIDESGRVIGDASDDHYQNLIRVVGQGADKRAGEAIALAETASSIRSRLRAAVLISERRWNLMLDNGVTLMLPQDKPEAALALIAQLDAKDGLLSKDIVSIDFRLADRMFVRMTPEAAARRTAEIKEREKLAKRKGAST
jgi:cell division protein FtsQ